MSKYKIFDKGKLELGSVFDRVSRHSLDSLISPESTPPIIDKEKKKIIEDLAKKMIDNKEKKFPIIIAYGGNMIRYGCSRVLVELMEKGYVQQFLTNGAGIIHDFEFAYLGKTGEDVRENVKDGKFGLWNETGKYLNKCIIEGAKKNQGLGESVGEMISKNILGKEIFNFNKQYSVAGRAYELNVPLSCCVGIGQDIIHTHPLCDGASLGKTSYTDFLIFANTLSNLEGGTFISIGSLVMSPMVFEKSMSMNKNLAKKEKKVLENYNIFVNEIQQSNWDWSKGDPPENNPEYRLRFLKSFSRMGGNFEYLELDERSFLHNLYNILK